MIKLAMQNGVGVTVVVLLVTIFGLLSLIRVPVQMTPDLAAQSVTVATIWPGATPQDIEKEIVIEQERFLRGIPGLEKMVASTSTGQANIELEFAVGVDIEEILVRVNNALSQVSSYPENVDQPRIVTSSASDQPIAWFSIRPLPGNPKNLDIVAMQDFLDDNVITEMERTPGVSEAQLRGGASRQVRVYVDPSKLAERGISIGELRSALRSRNRDISGGDFEEGKRRYLVRTLGRFTSLRDIEDSIIATRDGVPVYLREVATVELSRAQMRASVRHNGEQAMAMNVRRQAGTNIIEVMSAVQDTVERLNEGLLKEAGMVIRQVSDDTIYIREAVALMRQNLFVGAFLVTLMLTIFLRNWRTTAVGAIAVPICCVAAFIGLTVTGRTINVISLAGVGFAIGMTVDNTIVVLENIDRHRGMGKGRFEAAFDGVNEVWGAVLASTLTTVFVFLPIVLVQEEAGQLFADIAIAICAAILASMLVAITVIPTASASFLKRSPEYAPGTLGHRFHNLFGVVQLAERFRSAVMVAVEWLMRGVVRRIALVASMASGAILIAMFLAPQTEYLPDGNQPALFAPISPPPGYNLDEMIAVSALFEERFIPYLDHEPGQFARGETSVPALSQFFFVSTNDRVFAIARTQDPSQLDGVIGPMMAQISEVPGMFGFTTRPSIFARGLLGTRGIDIDIFGRDLDQIYAAVVPAAEKVRESLGVATRINAQPGLVLGQPFLEIRPNWERAAELGINSDDLGITVWSLTDGAYVDEFFLDDDKIDIYIYGNSDSVQRTQDLANLPVYTAAGSTVPLGSFAQVVQTVNTETIRRVDQRRAVTLTVTPPNDLALEEAVRRIEAEIIPALRDEGVLAEGVGVRIAGASDKLRATREAILGNFVLALIISYLLMVALFRHWGYPFIIMTSVPLGVMGGLVGLHLMNHGGDYFGWIPFLGVENIRQPLDVLTMMGFIVLVGTVVNNPILIVVQSLNFMRNEGMQAIEAVIESTRTRVRPIMMSMSTTVIGLSPLVFTPGSGAELYRGLGTVVLFGLFFSAIFTLTFIPSILSLLLQGREKLQPYLERLSRDDSSPAAARPVAPASAKTTDSSDNTQDASGGAQPANA